MYTWKNEPLRQPCHHPASYDPPVPEILSEYWDKQTENGPYESCTAQEQLWSVVFGQLTCTDLETDVAPEEGREHYVFHARPIWIRLEETG